MRRLLVAASALGLLAAPQAVPVSARARPPKKPPVAAAPQGPAPRVSLAVDAPTPRGPWTMRVTNDGEVPVRLSADARLLSLDVTPRGARAPVRCELPADMRPTDELESPLVLPPGRAYSETFEPRLYCFGAGKVDALASGSTVVAHLAWPGSASAAPYAVAPIDGVEPAVAPLKSVDSPVIALPDEPSFGQSLPAPPAQGTQTTPRGTDAETAARLVLTGAPAVDAAAAEGIDIAITLRNDGGQPVSVRLRPETLAFDVIGPDSVQPCVWPTVPGAAMREAFTRIAPGGSASLNVLLSAYCGGHTLDQAGLYVVRPRLDTRRASGESVGIRSFDGVVVAATPTVVRLHRGNAVPALRRPRLEPPPAK
jgi:hypothetical protein